MKFITLITVPATLVSALWDPSLIERSAAEELTKRQNGGVSLTDILSKLGAGTGTGGKGPQIISLGGNQFGGAAPVRATGASSITTTKTWNPPAELKAPLSWVYGNYTRELMDSGSAFHQIYKNKGKLNFCVQWPSRQTVTAAQRAAINKSLGSNVKKWIDVLAGYDGWEYPTVDVKVTAWAGSQSSLQGISSNEGFRYDGTKCNAKCDRVTSYGRYQGCPGGDAGHHDMTLDLNDQTPGGGKGYNGGQWLNAKDVLREVAAGASGDQDEMHIFVHEVGHGFGLDDFYSPTNPNNRRRPDRSGQIKRFLMKAGSSRMVTEFDAWMLRNLWTCLGPKIKGGQPPSHCGNVGSGLGSLGQLGGIQIVPRPKAGSGTTGGAQTIDLSKLLSSLRASLSPFRTFKPNNVEQ